MGDTSDEIRVEYLELHFLALRRTSVPRPLRAGDACSPKLAWQSSVRFDEPGSRI